MLEEKTGYKVLVHPDGTVKILRMTYVIRDGVEQSLYYGASVELTGTDLPERIAAAFLAVPEQTLEAAIERSGEEYKSMIRRRAAELAEGSVDDKYNALILLKEIGE